MMKTLRYAFARTLPIMAGYLVLGLGFGVLLQSKGYGVGWSLAMSALIYAGSMQYVTIDLLAGGASLISAALMTLMVNARHFFYGIAMLDRLGGTGRLKPYLIFAMSDETFSLLCSSPPPEGVSRKWFLFFIALLDHSYWIAGSVAGGLLGGLVSFNTAGIDFVLTAMFVVIFINQWKATSNHLPVLIGLGAALLCRIVLGPEKFLIPAMIVILVLVTLLRGPIEKRGDL